jgi:hypothetical protein
VLTAIHSSIVLLVNTKTQKVDCCFVLENVRILLNESREFQKFIHPTTKKVSLFTDSLHYDITEPSVYDVDTTGVLEFLKYIIKIEIGLIIA